MRSALATIIGFAALSSLTANAAEGKPGVVSQIVQKAGADFGLGAGVAVTAGLGLSKTWNAPLMEGGKQASIDVKGVDYGLKVRDQSVIGPKIQAYANKMPTATAAERVEHAFVAGVAKGATAAPMKEAHMEADIASIFERKSAAPPATQSKP